MDWETIEEKCSKGHQLKVLRNEKGAEIARECYPCGWTFGASRDIEEVRRRAQPSPLISQTVHQRKKMERRAK